MISSCEFTYPYGAREALATHSPPGLWRQRAFPSAQAAERLLQRGVGTVQGAVPERVPTPGEPGLKESAARPPHRVEGGQRASAGQRQGGVPTPEIRTISEPAPAQDRCPLTHGMLFTHGA